MYRDEVIKLIHSQWSVWVEVYSALKKPGVTLWLCNDTYYVKTLGGVPVESEYNTGYTLPSSDSFVALQVGTPLSLRTPQRVLGAIIHELCHATNYVRDRRMLAAGCDSIWGTDKALATCEDEQCAYVHEISTCLRCHWEVDENMVTETPDGRRIANMKVIRELVGDPRWGLPGDSQYHAEMSTEVDQSDENVKYYNDFPLIAITADDVGRPPVRDPN